MGHGRVQLPRSVESRNMANVAWHKPWGVRRNALPRGWGLLLALLGIALLAGCTNLLRLSADTRETRERLRILEGTIEAPTCGECPLIVVVLGDESPPVVHNFRVFERSGSFRIAALRESMYLFAFQDMDRDFSYQQAEPATWHELAGTRFAGLTGTDIALRLGGPLARPAPPGLLNLFEFRGATLGRVDCCLSH